jgi:cell division septation protein DedD
MPKHLATALATALALAALFALISYSAEAAPMVDEATVAQVQSQAQADAREQVQDQSRFYTVQFSTFKSKVKALALLAKLKQKGIDAFRSKLVYKGRAFYRVCAGSFSTPDAAIEMMRDYAKTSKFRHVFVQSVKGSSVPDETPPTEEAKR